MLGADVAARIAAGEVIERPASVVKELLDNALDAGAHRIEVELADAGLTRILVSDDGCGMDPEDALLAFSRHATSKLHSFDELEHLATLGFRGEALPSIAAVSRVELRTCLFDADAGTLVRLEGGGTPTVELAPAVPGTRVTVSDLFFNTPARRATLRSPRQESASIQAEVAAAALARPDVAFRLVHNGREALVTAGDGALLSAALALWGPEVARGLLPVAGRAGGWEVAGLCGVPSRARGDRGIQFLSVNARAVRCDAVRGAVEAAYRNLVMAQRFPLFILHLRGASDLYDPNVHPSKREVRFRDTEAVRGLCHAAVRAALRQAQLIPDVAPAAWGTAPLPAGDPPPMWSRPAEPAREAPGPWLAAEGGSAVGTPARRLPVLRPLGQVAEAYVVAAAADGLYLIDQHAAHERVFFERLCSRRAGPAQALVQPVPVELDEASWATWERHRPELAELGLSSEEFGTGAILVRTLPPGLDGDVPTVVAALLAEFSGAGHGPRTAALALAACRAAIKAGQPLGGEDLEQLLRELADCQEPFTCPHGRPTVLHLGLADMERHFGRR